MLIVGLTGGMGSGKSTVSETLKAEGAYVIDADEIARELVKPQSPAWEELVKAFGKEILEPDGSIHRRKLASLVFSSPRQRQLLQQILHPRIKEEIGQRVKEIRQKDSRAIVVIDAPLLIETGDYREMDKIIVVISTEAQQVERVKKRDQLSDDQIRAILSCQMPLEEKVKVADYVIRNEGSMEETRQKAREMFRALKRDAWQREEERTS